MQRVFEIDYKTKEYINIGQIEEDIIALEEIEPKKADKNYQLWCENINYLFDKYNFMSKFVAYKKK